MGLGLDIQPLAESKMIALRQVDPAELSPGEFSHAVRQAVEVDGASIIVIDSLTGDLNAMPTDSMLTLHLHELLTYLGQRGVTTLLILTQRGFLGDTDGIEASYVVDTVSCCATSRHSARSVKRYRSSRHGRESTSAQFAS